jgi:ubiquitin C-terminal hydrolase
MGVLSIQCEVIEVQTGRLEPKQIDSTTSIYLQGNEIYVGSHWKIKGKELRHIDTDYESNEICIETEKNIKFRFIPPFHQSTDEKGKWDSFMSRIQKLYDKFKSPEKPSFTNFIQNSNKHRLGGITSYSNKNNTKQPPHRSIEASIPSQHQQQRRQRGMFGSQKAILPMAPINDKHNWVDSTSTNTSYIKQTPASKLISGGDRKKRKLLTPTEHFTSDEEEDDVEIEINSPPEPDIEVKAEEEQDDQIESSNNDALPVAAIEEKEIPVQNMQETDKKVHYKRKITKMKSNMSKDDGEQSDDDDIFNEIDLTTPAAQRVVSPNADTTNKTSSSNDLIQKRISDETDDSTDDITNEKRIQPSIDSFFQPQQRKIIARPVVPDTPAKTPPRHTITSARIARAALSTIQQSSAMKKKRFDDDSSTKWLLTSPTRKLRSPEEKRRNELFGPEIPSANRRKQDSFNILQNDPIEEYPSSPTRPLLDNINYHRPVERTSAYRPLDFSKQKRRITPTLVNRFATNVHTPAAVLNYALTNSVADDMESTTNNNNTTMSLYRKFRGLRNLGNTCYQNSSLQMLYTCSSLMMSLQARLKKDGGGPIIQSLCSIANELSTFYMPSVNSSMLKDAMDVKTDKYIGYEQRDAHEFISDLIDFVHEEMVETEKSNTQQEESLAISDDEKYRLPTDDFTMAVQVSLKCCSCGYARTKEELYRHLSIDIISDEELPDPNSTVEVVTVSMAKVEKSLEHFFQPEIREIKCEKCTDGSHAEQTLRIVKPPKLLLLHLKRFIVVERVIYPATSELDVENRPPYNSSTTTAGYVIEEQPQVEYIFKKNKAPMAIPPSLSLEPYHQTSTQQTPTASPTSSSSTNASVGSSKSYKLQSIVHHIGSRASSGHYTADAIREVYRETQEETNYDQNKSNVTVNKDLEKVWVSYDDGFTNETSIEKILSNRFKQSTAYMLLYSNE